MAQSSGQDTGMAVFYDSAGMVIATEGLIVAYPWEVRHSAKFEGRFYFFNLETKKSAWSLTPDKLGIVDEPAEAKQGGADHGPPESMMFPPIGNHGSGDEAKHGGSQDAATLKPMTSKSMVNLLHQTPNPQSGGPDLGGAFSPRGGGGGAGAAAAAAMHFANPLDSDAKESGDGGHLSPLGGHLSHNKEAKGYSQSTNNLVGIGVEAKGGGGNAGGGGHTAGGGWGPAAGHLLDGGSLLHYKGGRPDMRTSNNTAFGSSNNLAGSISSNSLAGSRSVHDLTSLFPQSGRSDVVVPPIAVTGGLGQGGYACVLRCEHMETGQEFALKVVSKARTSRRRDRARLRLELRTMTELPFSPFLQRCHMAFESPTDLFFVVDHVGGGDLFFHLVQRITKQGWGFSEGEARVLLSEAILALEHLHAHGMMHRDVKVENLMLDSRGHVKLVDFGLCCELKGPDERVSPTGSLIYMAPEMIRDHRGGRHTDWWALGVLSYELLTGRTPWSSLTDKKVIRKEIQTLCVAPPHRLSPPAGQLVCSLLRQDFHKRLGTGSDSELRQASFFRGVDWEATANQTNEPAFLPPKQVTHQTDREAALKIYLAKKQQQEGIGSGGVGDGGGDDDGTSEEWYLGLHKVAEHPKYRPEARPSSDEGGFF